MKKVLCKICDLDWGVSERVKANKYVCPYCQWKIDHKQLIMLGDRKN